MRVDPGILDTAACRPEPEASTGACGHCNSRRLDTDACATPVANSMELLTGPMTCS